MESNFTTHGAQKGRNFSPAIPGWTTKSSQSKNWPKTALARWNASSVGMSGAKWQLKSIDLVLLTTKPVMLCPHRRTKSTSLALPQAEQAQTPIERSWWLVRVAWRRSSKVPSKARCWWVDRCANSSSTRSPLLRNSNASCWIRRKKPLAWQRMSKRRTSTRCSRSRSWVTRRYPITTCWVS